MAATTSAASRTSGEQTSQLSSSDKRKKCICGHNHASMKGCLLYFPHGNSKLGTILLAYLYVILALPKC